VGGRGAAVTGCKTFDAECPGCRPVLFGLDGKVLPPNDPVMVTVNAVWDAAPLEEKQAFHAVCVLNSRDKGDLALLARLRARLERAGVS
jgi:hypothetical protein